MYPGLWSDTPHFCKGVWFYTVDKLNFLNSVAPGGLDIRKCRARAVSYQGLFNVLVSFVLPFEKIVGSLLTFPFRQAGQSWGNAYS